ncbi:MAG TPA: 6-phosphogluconolactonase [Gammaproteobacteria bacterium]|jgi:6-phosphogluconolactonase|nr:6-phosphogluconolactonase [Gammaproteobacteria bacterium]
MVAFKEFKTRDAAATALARRVGDRLRRGVHRRATASMIVSGGTSPLGLYHELRMAPLPWCLVTIVPSDERWVPVEDAASNEGMIRRELLSGEPGFAHLVSLYRRDATPAQSLPQLNEALAEVPRPFDTVIVGMGEDGHVASLFPDSPDIAAALATEADCVVQNVPRLGMPRVSLTTHSLLDARDINVLFFGSGKRAVYEAALKPGPLEEYPIRALVHQPRVPVSVYWAP